MALLIRSYHDILQFLPISCQDLAKILLRYPWRVDPGSHDPVIKIGIGRFAESNTLDLSIVKTAKKQIS